MYRLHLRFKCFKKKRFIIFYFSNNINDFIHRLLNNAVYIRFFDVNQAILLSLVRPIVLRKYDLRKYVNTFKVRSQTSVNKHNPTCARYFILFLLLIGPIVFFNEKSDHDVT